MQNVRTFGTLRDSMLSVCPPSVCTVREGTSIPREHDARSPGNTLRDGRSPPDGRPKGAWWSRAGSSRWARFPQPVARPPGGSRRRQPILATSGDIPSCSPERPGGNRRWYHQPVLVTSGDIPTCSRERQPRAPNQQQTLFGSEELGSSLPSGSGPRRRSRSLRRRWRHRTTRKMRPGWRSCCR